MLTPQEAVVATINLRLHQAALLLLVGGIAGALLTSRTSTALADDAVAVPDVVRAKRFEFLSPEGKKAGEIHWWPRQGPHLTLYRSNGEISFDLGVVTGDEPQMVVNNSKGEQVLLFQLSPRGHPAFTFSYAGARRTIVGVGPLGHALLGLNGHEAFPAASFALAEDGTPTFEVVAKDGTKIWKAP